MFDDKVMDVWWKWNIKEVRWKNLRMFDEKMMNDDKMINVWCFGKMVFGSNKLSFKSQFQIKQILNRLKRFQKKLSPLIISMPWTTPLPFN